MALPPYPYRGQKPWDTDLKAYVDARALTDEGLIERDLPVNGAALDDAIAAGVGPSAAEQMSNPETALNAATIEVIDERFGGGLAGLVKMERASLTNLNAPRPAWAGVVEWLIHPGDPDPTNKAAGDKVSEVAATPYPANLLWLDWFSRAANPTSLGSTQVGAKAWTQYAATDAVFGVSDYKAAVTAGTAGIGMATVNAGVARTLFKAKIAVQSSGFAGLVFRYVDSSNYCLVTRSASTAPFYYRVSKIVGGVATNVRISTTVMASGDQIEIDDRVLGTLTVKVNGVVVYDQTVHTAVTMAGVHEAATRQGIYTGSGAARVAFDDLEVYSAP